MVNVENVEKGSELQWESEGVLLSKFQNPVEISSVLLELKSHEVIIESFLHTESQSETSALRGMGYMTEPECCPSASKAQRRAADFHAKYLRDVSEEPVCPGSREELEVSLRRPLPDEQDGELVYDEDKKHRGDQLAGGGPADRSEPYQSLHQRHC